MSDEKDPQAMREQAARNDVFEDLVRLHRCELTRYAVRQLGEHAGLAEDVVQEALLSAHRAIVAGTHPEHPRAWLFTIVRNAAVNATRSARPTTELDEDRHGAAEQVPAAVEQSEWIDWLMGAVGELPARQREALVGHAFEGRSYRELAARQQTTVSAVKSLIGRARRALESDASLPVAGLGAPLAAGMRALRGLLGRGPLAGKAGGAKGLVGALAQVALAATVTTGVLMAVHSGTPSAVFASTGPHRSTNAGKLQTRTQTTGRHRSEGKRAREQRIHRESRHAVKACLNGKSVRGHYRPAALRYAARHLSTVMREYTDCERQLRAAALRPAKARAHRGSSHRHGRHHSSGRAS
jgi:RNA polymerase sigma-70 factor (ECF subfamily)